MTPAQQEFLLSAAKEAKAGGHIFPAMAACEAAVESAWGTSELAHKANNLFGAKQQMHPVYGSVEIPTREFLDHKWVTENAAWVEYPDVATCFKERMATLQRLATTYPHYGMALIAQTPEEYVKEVSLSWSTGPNRATVCIEIFHAHEALLTASVE